MSDSLNPTTGSSRAETAPAAASFERSALVVERDPHVRELQLNFLTRAGFAVQYAADGRTGLAIAEREIPNLVVTEILVPKLDGLALCRQLKSGADTSQVAVLVCSMLVATSRAREAGADAFLKKPLAEQRFIEAVNGIFTARQTTA